VDELSSLVDVGSAVRFAPRIQLFKGAGTLTFKATESNGKQAQLSAPIDAWTSAERHAVTATWTRATMALYVDDALIGTADLAAPVGLRADTILSVGHAGGNVTLEDLDVFAGP